MYSDNGADIDDSSDDRMSLSSVYSNASRPCSTLVNVSDSKCVLVNLDCNQSSDPGLGLQPFSSELVDFWIEKVPIACQNNDGAFLKSKRVYNANGKKVNRKLNADSFKRKLPNGEIVARDWLIYSLSLGCVYCFACVLFSKEENQFSKGFADWKHASTMLGYHEKVLTTSSVDCELVKQHEKE